MPSETKITTWLDIMPAIPLARGVPVTDRRGGLYFTRGIAASADLVWIDDGGHGQPSTPDDGDDWVAWRVDLDDPQGFGYTLRWLRANAGKIQGRTPPHPMLNEMTLGGHISDGLLRQLGDGKHGRNVGMRHLYGGTTNDDRLALARAIAEVQS